MRAIVPGPARRADVQNQILTVASREFSVGCACIITGPGSNAWASANDPLALPFRLSRTSLLAQIGWMNGTAAGGGIDVGIYDRSWARLVSSGSVTGSGNNAWQFTDVADTVLYGGIHYYLVMARDNTTANRVRSIAVGGTTAGVAITGAQDSATDAFPLPNPLTNMAAAATFTTIPVMALAFRAPF